MVAGTLKEVISVEKQIAIRDEFGANKLVWVQEIPRTRAKVTYSNGNRVNENNEIIFAYEVIFTIRIYHHIEEQYRIIWKNKKYRILSLEPDKAKQQLIIRAELINE